MTKKSDMTPGVCHATGKAAYYSRRACKRSAKNRAIKSRKPIYVYTCPFCGLWHMTSKGQGWFTRKPI